MVNKARLRAALAVILSLSLGVSPTLAQVVPSVHLSVPSAAGPSAAAGSSFGTLAPASPRLDSIQLSQSSLLLPAPFAAPVVQKHLSTNLVQTKLVDNFSAAPSQAPRVRATSAGIAAVRAAAAKAVAGLDKAGGDASSVKARAQFATLTSEPLSAAPADGSVAIPAGKMGGAPSRLSKSTAGAVLKKIGGVARVFKDPERNKSFWRYMLGYGIFLFGFQMYIVGLPYLVSSMTRNALNENRDARAGSETAIAALIHANRSLSRIAHWTAQVFSHTLNPLFTRSAQTEGPRKLLLSTSLIRGAVLALVPALFFATGLLSVSASLWLLLGLLAVQSFFQGLAVTAEGASTARIIGDRSVTTAERTKANSVMTFVSAAFAIISPLVAGVLASIGPVMGKTGVGSAVIYAIYAGAVALSGFVYSTISMLSGPSAGVDTTKTRGPPRKGLLATLKSLWLSIKEGTTIVFKDRLLRTMLLITVVASLVSDPLIFSVLPVYVEKLVLNNPNSLGILMSIPGVGWFLKLLASTPMGNFSIMMFMSSVGGILSAVLIKPLKALLDKLGFKTEESKTVPFYILAALEAPLFLLMINTPTLLGVVTLYGLQAMLNGFIGIAISGLYQKNLGEQNPVDINKILAAQSLIAIVVAIISTFIYGFLLNGVALSTTMIIAAVAIGAMGLLRLAAPFLSFSKEARDHGSDKK